MLVLTVRWVCLVCLILDCWLTQCCVDYRVWICRGKYLALLVEIRRQRQAQREREEHEEEERRRQQLEGERKRRLEQENLSKTCPLCSQQSVLVAVACVKVVCVCVCVYRTCVSTSAPAEEEEAGAQAALSAERRTQCAASDACAAATQQAVRGVTSVTYPNITPEFMRLPPQPSIWKIIYVPSPFSSL